MACIVTINMHSHWVAFLFEIEYVAMFFILVQLAVIEHCNKLRNNNNNNNVNSKHRTAATLYSLEIFFQVYV